MKGFRMSLLAFIGGMAFGYWLFIHWGNHRAKYYKSKLEETIYQADRLCLANENMIGKMQKMGVKLDRYRIEKGELSNEERKWTKAANQVISDKRFVKENSKILRRKLKGYKNGARALG